MLFYLIGPYFPLSMQVLDEPDAHEKLAEQVSERLWAKGHAVINPYVNHYRLNNFQSETARRQLILRADACLLLPGYQLCEQPQADVLFAQNHGVWLVSVNTLDDLPELHLTEARSPNQSLAFLSTVLKMYRTHLAKNSDYSPANILGTGEVGGTVRTWDKVARMMSLLGWNIRITSNCFDDEQVNARLLENTAERLGMSAVLHRIWDETIKTLDDAGFHMEVEFLGYTGEKKSVNESVDDSIMDLSVYAIILRLVRQGLWGH